VLETPPNELKRIFAGLKACSRVEAYLVDGVGVRTVIQHQVYELVELPDTTVVENRAAFLSSAVWLASKVFGEAASDRRTPSRRRAISTGGSSEASTWRSVGFCVTQARWTARQKTSSLLILYSGRKQTRARDWALDRVLRCVWRARWGARVRRREEERNGGRRARCSGFYTGALVGWATIAPSSQQHRETLGDGKHRCHATRTDPHVRTHIFLHTRDGRILGDGSQGGSSGMLTHQKVLPVQGRLLIQELITEQQQQLH